MIAQLRLKQSGFTLIEVLVFVFVTSLVMSSIFLGSIISLRNAPTVHQEWVAMQLAQQCMEYLLDQRRLNGYTIYSCGSAPAPTACSGTGGYTITTSVSCITWNSDAAYKTITVNVTGTSMASLSVQVGNY